MKNKGGEESTFLASYVIKIIIAVICILVLVGIPSTMYASITKDKANMAEMSINGEHGLANEILRINKGGDFDEQGFRVSNPSGWYLFSFVGDEKKPNLCAGDNCICICEKVLIEFSDNQLENCDNKGTCFVVKNLKNFEKIKIGKDGVVVLIQKLNGSIVISKK